MPEGPAKRFLTALEEVKTASIPRTVDLIREFRLAREHLPTSVLNEVAIWRALCPAMPLTALLRNLTKMTSVGLLTDRSTETATVVRRLTDKAELTKARLHPFNILVGLKTYSKGGEGGKGSVRCTPVPAITAALDQAYTLAFTTIIPTGKRFLLGMDVSGSMTCGGVNGSTVLSPREAAAALAMCTMRTEPKCTPVAFSDKLVPFPMTAQMDLTTVMNLADRIPFGGTYCDLPMTWALENRVPIDVFMIFTDCETATKTMTPAAALRAYRTAMGIPAKLIVFGFTSNGFTLADPVDAGMLDMAGFDASAPELVRRFILGEI